MSLFHVIIIQSNSTSISGVIVNLHHSNIWLYVVNQINTHNCVISGKSGGQEITAALQYEFLPVWLNSFNPFRLRCTIVHMGVLSYPRLAKGFFLHCLCLSGCISCWRSRQCSFSFCASFPSPCSSLFFLINRFRFKRMPKWLSLYL